MFLHKFCDCKRLRTAKGTAEPQVQLHSAHAQGWRRSGEGAASFSARINFSTYFPMTSFSMLTTVPSFANWSVVLESECGMSATENDRESTEYPCKSPLCYLVCTA